jgi:hypothetical protein
MNEVLEGKKPLEKYKGAFFYNYLKLKKSGF